MLAFKIFMFVMISLIPATMLVFGYRWKTHPPKEINGAYGYRTRRSMFSRRTWDFAHEVCGRAWRRLGWWTLGISLAVTISAFVLLQDISAVGHISVAITFLQMIPLIAAIPATERALKNRFGI